MSRGALWTILQFVGVLHKLSVLIRTFHSDTRSSVSLEFSLSEGVTVETGVKQGCVLATGLFNCVIDRLVQRMTNRCRIGIKRGNYTLTDLDCADDIAVFTFTIGGAQQLQALTLLREEANHGGLTINWTVWT